jgi:hypothetical protein
VERGKNLSRETESIVRDMKKHKKCYIRASEKDFKKEVVTDYNM